MASSELTARETGADKGPYIMAIILAIQALCTVFVAGRIYTRGKILAKMDFDDWIIMASNLCGWLSVTFSTLAVKSGAGRHIDTLSTEQISGALFYTMIGFLPGVLSFGLPKLAVIYLLTRLLLPTPRQIIFLWTIGILCIISLMGCVLILFFQCSPSKAQWDFSIKDKKCLSPWVLSFGIMAFADHAAVVLSAAVDLYLAVYPATVLFTLQMNVLKKCALSFALGLGSIACVVGIYKTTRLPGLATADFSWNTADLVIWTCIEGATIIIASCIPVLKPLVEAILGRKIFSSSFKSDHPQYQNYGAGRSGVYGADIELTATRGKVKMGTLTQIMKDGSQDSILPNNSQTGALKCTRSVDVTVTDESDNGTESQQQNRREW